MQTRKAIIFDFDGTIADSFAIFIEALSVVIRRRPPLTTNDIDELRKSSSIKEIIKKLGIKPWQMPLVIARGRREISARMERIAPFTGIAQALKEISAEYTVYIVSTNSEENITGFLEKHGMADYIHVIHGGISIMRKHKSLKKLLKKENLTESFCLYIGDETRDIEAARKTGIKCIAVEWGYSRPDALRRHTPDALVARPEDLPRTIKGLLA